jgi:uncharacterized damage-inducible protein DinB
MSHKAHFTVLAQYNQWMNDKVYATAATLPATELAADRGAFFGSILGTLNHLLVADLLWLRRCAGLPGQGTVLAALAEQPVPTALNQLLFADFTTMQTHRQQLDALIRTWLAASDEALFEETLRYTNMIGEAQEKPLWQVLLHFFNHQTHHRGQVTTLLSQAGVDVGVTDLARMPLDPA